MFTRAYTSASDNLMAEPTGTRIFFNASTSTLARDGMSLRPDRWRLDNYHRSGGPVLWAHKHDRPAIGAGEAKTEPSRLRIGVVFDQEDDFARSIESKVRRRFLRGSSVGWDFVDQAGQVVRHQRLSPDRMTRDLWYDLSEFSIVNVPADPQAVAERHWSALRSIDPDLARLFTDQERVDSDVTAPELRRAVTELCTRLGIDVNLHPTADIDDEPQAPESRLLRRDELPDLLRAYGTEASRIRGEHGPELDVPHPGHTVDPPVSGIDSIAARAVLAAFQI